jgi:anti-anti-sigma factor
VAPAPGGHRLALRGELDLASAANLRDTVARLCAEGDQRLVLDIGELTFIDSTGLRAILTSRAECEQAGCTLAITPAAEEVPPQVRRLLQVTGLLERLPFDEQG